MRREDWLEDSLGFWITQTYPYKSKQKEDSMPVFLFGGIFLQFVKVLLGFLFICFQAIGLILGLLLRLVFFGIGMNWTTNTIASVQKRKKK